jgi:polar amino acid transport system substrate-binding protein
VLYFPQPYYTTPAVFFVHKDNNTFSQPGDLSGQRVGVCVNCSYEAYLQSTLTMPGQKIDFKVKDAIITGYDAEPAAFEDLIKGDGLRLDAVLTNLPTGQNLIQGGAPIKQLGEPVFLEYLSTAVDKKSDKDPVGFVQKVSDIIQQMHSDGTLLKLSQQYFGVDLTTAASQFNPQALGQLP